jgi:hypothetical protein
MVCVLMVLAPLAADPLYRVCYSSSQVSPASETSPSSAGKIIHIFNIRVDLYCLRPGQQHSPLSLFCPVRSIASSFLILIIVRYPVASPESRISGILYDVKRGLADSPRSLNITPPGRHQVPLPRDDMISNSGQTTPGAGDMLDSPPEKSPASMVAAKPRKKGN